MASHGSSEQRLVEKESSMESVAGSAAHKVNIEQPRIAPCIQASAGRSPILQGLSNALGFERDAHGGVVARPGLSDLLEGPSGHQEVAINTNCRRNRVVDRRILVVPVRPTGLKHMNLVYIKSRLNTCSDVAIAINTHCALIKHLQHIPNSQFEALGVEGLGRRRQERWPLASWLVRRPLTARV
jgi:hypothetical protein